MSDLKLFRIDHGSVEELASASVSLEKSLQTLFEKNLEALLGVRFVASEYSTGKTHGGRIDTLGFDENHCPVILEYKRTINENVINQGLYYLDWLLDHKAEFKLLVLERFGKQESDGIDWSSPRLVCIASDFTRYDEHAVGQINRNIELIRYRRFGESLLLLELVNAVTADDPQDKAGTPTQTYKQISKTLEGLDRGLAELYENLRAHLLALGDDVQEKTLKFYVAFKRIKNFACVDVHPTKGCVSVFLKVDPGTVVLEEGFTRDVSEIGHFGTGDLEVTLRSVGDLERAKPLFLRSYEAS